MEANEHEKNLAYDTLFTNSHIQMLNAAMSYFDVPLQRNLAIFVKFLELQQALSLSRTHSFEVCGCSKEGFSKEKKELDIPGLCTAILPFCSKEERPKIEQILQIFRSMETFREISTMMELMKDMSPSFDSASADNGEQHTGPGGGMMDMLMGMLSPEQQTMFEMFGGNNSHESE